MTQCKIDQCERKVYAKQLCNMHYLRVWKTGNPGKAESTFRSRRNHGLDGHPLQSRWEGIMQRCYNPKHESYRNYGGRGITVCERWWHFPNFVADVGTPPSPLHTIDRINNNGNYEPTNFQWATRKEQALNRRTNA